MIAQRFWWARRGKLALVDESPTGHLDVDDVWLWQSWVYTVWRSRASFARVRLPRQVRS